MVLSVALIFIWLLTRGFNFETDMENFSASGLGIAFSVAFIQGLLCYGLIKKRPGFLTPWLFVSYIVIIGLAVNFGYVS